MIVNMMVVDTVVKCDADLKKKMFGNIVLNGGNTISPGLYGRVKQGLRVFERM